MTTDTPATASRASWLAALDALRVKEKAMTAQLDALAAERRRLPRERVDGDYEFDTAEGRVGLADLFAGRRQPHRLPPHAASWRSRPLRRMLHVRRPNT